VFLRRSETRSQVFDFSNLRTNETHAYYSHVCKLISTSLGIVVTYLTKIGLYWMEKGKSHLPLQLIFNPKSTGLSIDLGHEPRTHVKMMVFYILCR
jgi:hypothetical protein